jgi:glycosyltransferase involved in cell wall biosynthesis
LTGCSSIRGRILVIDHKTPTPDQDSGSASAFSYLQILSRAGFDVTFAPMNLKRAGRYTKALKALGIKTLSSPEWPSINAVLDAFAPRSDIVLLYRVLVAMHLFDRARQVAPAAKILFHAVDLHFLRNQREAAVTGRQAHADASSLERTIELDLIARADASIVVSNYEFDLLHELVPAANLYRIPILRETPRRPFGLALHWSARRLCRRLGPFGRWLNGRDPSLRRRCDFLFIGGYNHPPNVDAVQWFVREVWPLLQARGFPHRLIIAGSNVPDNIAALASDKIVVRGYVENLAQLFAACRLSIAPLRYGAGIKGKVVTSLSYGVPVVATSIAAEGAGLRHGENILIADTAEAMADQLIRLYDDADLWQRLSENAYQAFQNNFSQAAGAQKVLDVVNGLIAQ